nr:MAG TPA: hypothetical protein [Caudoviricetes sp.]
MISLLIIIILSHIQRHYIVMYHINIRLLWCYHQCIAYVYNSCITGYSNASDSNGVRPVFPVG